MSIFTPKFSVVEARLAEVDRNNTTGLKKPERKKSGLRTCEFRDTGPIHYTLAEITGSNPFLP